MLARKELFSEEKFQHCRGMAQLFLILDGLHQPYYLKIHRRPEEGLGTGSEGLEDRGKRTV